MIRLLILLFGLEPIYRKWRLFSAAGLFWVALGGFLIIDALDGKTLIHAHYFGYLIIPEACVCAILAAAKHKAVKMIHLVQSIFLSLLSLLIISGEPKSHILVAFIFGTYFLFNGIFRVGSAWVIRFPNWRWGVIRGWLEILLAFITIQPWPTFYSGTIGFTVGALTLLGGISLVAITLGVKFSNISAEKFKIVKHGVVTTMKNERVGPTKPLAVHIWRPRGASRKTVHGRVINRYIAAIDSDGTVSTGHAALEMGEDIYISHYPADDLDRGAGEFISMLKATRDNDMAGRFLDSYAEESSQWVPSSDRIHFADFDAERLHAFWAEYRKDECYNLTRRNCSTAVAAALDAALEGVLSKYDRPLVLAVKILLAPEFWVAVLIRKKAEAMTWTPGLVLDYARSLSVIISGVSNNNSIVKMQKLKESFQFIQLNKSQ